ncbi:MAG: DUF1587 domain-containing protein [Verrucomicrobiota bacterium]
MRLAALVLPIFASTAAFAFESEALLVKYCFDCHDDLTEKAGFSLESLEPDFLSHATHDVWIRVHDRIEKREMPPRDKPQPSDVERQQLLAALAKELRAASLKHQEEGRVVVRRLNRVEYENTIRDLLGIGVELQSLLP